MRFLSTALVAGALTATTLLAGAPAFAQGANMQGWSQPSWSQPFCKLRINRVYQPNAGQPIHVVLSSESNVRIAFTLDVTLRGGNGQPETHTIRVDNMNPGETNQDKPTDQGYRSRGNAVSLALTSCQQRS